MGLAAAVGGLFYLRLVLRPPAGADGLMAAARGRALTLVMAGTLLAAGAELLLLLLVHPWALAEDSGRWPLREFLTTEFGLAGLGRIALALGLAATVPWIRRARTARAPGRWPLAGWHPHGEAAWLAARGEPAPRPRPLMLGHRCCTSWARWSGSEGCSIWSLRAALAARGRPAAEPLGARVFARFSVVAIGAPITGAGAA